MDFLCVHLRLISLSGVTELLMAPGKYPNCSGTRNLSDNLSDLKAQVAANQKVRCGQREKCRGHHGTSMHARWR